LEGRGGEENIFFLGAQGFFLQGGEEVSKSRLCLKFEEEGGGVRIRTEDFFTGEGERSFFGNQKK
jgi:hypothetical protein